MTCHSPRWHANTALHRRENACICLHLCVDLDTPIKRPRFENPIDEKHQEKLDMDEWKVRHVTVLCVDANHADRLTWDETCDIMSRWTKVTSLSVYDYPNTQRHSIQDLPLLGSCTTLGVYWYQNRVLDLSSASVLQKVTVKDHYWLRSIKIGPQTTQLVVQSRHLEQINLIGASTALRRLDVSWCYSLRMESLNFSQDGVEVSLPSQAQVQKYAVRKELDRQAFRAGMLVSVPGDGRMYQ